MNRALSFASLWIAILLGVAITAHGEDAAQAAPKQADQPAAPASDNVLTLSGPAKADSASTAAPAPALPPETILTQIKPITVADVQVGEMIVAWGKPDQTGAVNAQIVRVAADLMQLFGRGAVAQKPPPPLPPPPPPPVMP